MAYRYSKKDLFEICKKLNISKISSKNKTELINIIDININNKIKVLSTELQEKIKYAKLIFEFIKKIKYYKFIKKYCKNNKGYGKFVKSGRSHTGLGKWLVIVNCKDNPNICNYFDDHANSDWLSLYNNFKFLDNIIGVTDWKVWKKHDDANISNTACICIYCGVSEEILDPNKQYKWILHIGNKLSKIEYILSKIEYIKNISIINKIYFKENSKTRQGIYSDTHNNVCPLYVEF
jgi:hypothetical protein